MYGRRVGAWLWIVVTLLWCTSGGAWAQRAGYARAPRALEIAAAAGVKAGEVLPEEARIVSTRELRSGGLQIVIVLPAPPPADAEAAPDSMLFIPNVGLVVSLDTGRPIGRVAPSLRAAAELTVNSPGVWSEVTPPSWASSPRRHTEVATARPRVTRPVETDGPAVPVAPVEAPVEAQAPAPAQTEGPAAATEAPMSLPQEGPFDGLIVDCRGLGVTRSMSPKIVDDAGTEVYGTMPLDQEEESDQGPVRYARSLEVLTADGKHPAGSNPLYVKAVSASGPGAVRVNAIVAAQDAELIKTEDARTGFLEARKVFFLVDD